MGLGTYFYGILLNTALLLSSARCKFVSIEDVWMLTDLYGDGGFEGEVVIPVSNSITAWKIELKFNKPIRKFEAYEAELDEESKDQTSFIVKNAVWNGYLQNGDEIYFRIQGFAEGEAPTVTITYKDTVYKYLPPRERPKPINARDLRKIMGSKVDYEKAIKLSMKFFQAQKSGYTTEDNEVTWKESSGLYDGGLEGVNLVGGYYIGGDYVKFNYPMAFAITQLVWGALEFSDGYEDAGQMENLFKTVKWAADYFIKCHTSRDEYYGMVGDPDIEMKLWESSQNMDWKRPAYKITPNHPGSDLAGETAAALAAASILFKTTAPVYAKTLLKHAEEIWHLGERNRGRYDFRSIPKASAFYRSSSYHDELVWGALWLYKATKNRFYMEFVQTLYGRLNLKSENGLSYDDKLLGIQILLADMTDDYRTYMSPVKEFCDSPVGFNSYTLPNGLAYKDVPKGTIMFSANSAFVCAIVARRTIGTADGRKYRNFVKSQVHVILGTGKRRGFMVGFGRNYPKNLHHRDSSCPTPPTKCGWEFYNDSSAINSHEIEGGLVGGPNGFGEFDDKRQNKDQNQPNILFNSAFQSAVAGLIMLTSGEIESSGAGSGDYFEETEPFKPSQNLRHVFRKTGLENYFDACFSNPCQNGGFCNSIDGMKFSCECDDIYYGKLCEETLNPQFQWISTWPNGAQVHVHLPTAMFDGKKELTLAFPPACPISLIEVWHACLVPHLSNITNGIGVIRQVGRQTEQKFIGLKYEFDGKDPMKACFRISDFAFKISSQEEGNPECVRTIPEVEEKVEEPTTTTKPHLQNIKPVDENRLLGNSINAGLDILPTQITEKRIPGIGSSFVGDLGLVPADTGTITWVSRWGTGGHGTINLNDIKASAPGGWVLRFLFPIQCRLKDVEFWHACVVEDLSNPGQGLFTFKQVGWQGYQQFIGMNVEFKDTSPSVDCLDVTQYHLIYEESHAGASLLPEQCKLKFNETDMDVEADIDPLPFIVIGGDGEPKFDEAPEKEKEGLVEAEKEKKEIKSKSTKTKTPKPMKQNTPKIDLKNLWLRGIKPTPPTNLISVDRLRAQKVSSSTIRISWRRPRNKAKKVQVKYNAREKTKEEEKENSDQESQEEEQKGSEPKIAKLKHAGSESTPTNPISIKEISRKKNRVFIKNLLPGKEYEFTVRTWDGRSYGPENAITVTLEPSDITNIRTTNPNETSLKFEWERPRGYRKSYRISYFPDTPTGNPKSPFALSSEETQVTVTGLAKETDYIFIFAAEHSNTATKGKYIFAKTGSNLCGTKQCPKQSDCAQIENGADCVCDIGFVGRQVLSLSLGKRTMTCYDVDECSRENICDTNAKCVNTIGSYTCKCNIGYKGDGFSCTDEDECSLDGLDVCPGATCKNTFGSYECECEEGYTYKRSSCVDLDECATGQYICPEDADCVNLIGAYTCLCPNGTKYFENECQDIDECRTRNHNCLKSEVCLNTRGSFSCVCRKGKRKTKRGCKDINECREKTHKCSKNAACRNIRSGYRCSCKRGYAGNGFKCKDIDECQQTNKCDKEGGVCTNAPGYYTCSCKHGFTGNGKQCFSLF